MGLAAIVRVGKNDPPQIQRALDIGSAGVQVPQIETKSDAAAVKLKVGCGQTKRTSKLMGYYKQNLPPVSFAPTVLFFAMSIINC